VKKDLDYYMNLPYTIEVVPIPDSEGGGYTAQLPQLGRFAIVGDGETIEEAITDLENLKRDRLTSYLEDGIEIPEPEPEKETYSGRFLVRIPKVLHRQLAEAAKENQTSLNLYVTYLLSTNFNIGRQQEQFNTIIDQLDFMCDAIWDVHYSFDEFNKEIKEPDRAEQIQLKAA
jgi:predicted HicB family RNase H-like nuclease